MHPKYLAIILLATVAICAGAIYYEKQPATYVEPVPVHHVEKTIASTTPTSTLQTNLAGWQTYTNTDYGFQLTFPESWKGYKTPDGLSFEVPTTATWTPEPGWFVAFQIIPYTEDQWQQIESQNQPQPTVIDDNGATVFTWQGAQDTPDDLQGKINPEDVIKTFKLTQTSPTPTITSQTDTSGWKTYTNSQYGFSFEYPANWYVNNGDSSSTINLLSPDTYAAQGGADEPPNDIGINILDNTQNLSATGFVNLYESGWFKSYDQVRNVTIGGIASEQYDDSNSNVPHTPLVATFIPFQGKMIDIDLFQDSSFLSNYNQILSTFKFTN